MHVTPTPQSQLTMHFPFTIRSKGENVHVVNSRWLKTVQSNIQETGSSLSTRPSRTPDASLVLRLQGELAIHLEKG